MLDSLSCVYVGVWNPWGLIKDDGHSDGNVEKSEVEKLEGGVGSTVGQTT